MGKQKSQKDKYTTRAFSLSNIRIEKRADGEPGRITGIAAVLASCLKIWAASERRYGRVLFQSLSRTAIAERLSIITLTIF